MYAIRSYYDIYLQEQPRLNQITFYGVTKTQESDLRDKLDLSLGKQITNNTIRNSEIIIKNFFAEKGFLV